MEGSKPTNLSAQGLLKAEGWTPNNMSDEPAGNSARNMKGASVTAPLVHRAENIP